MKYIRRFLLFIKTEVSGESFRTQIRNIIHERLSTIPNVTADDNQVKSIEFQVDYLLNSITDWNRKIDTNHCYPQLLSKGHNFFKLT